MCACRLELLAQMLERHRIARLDAEVHVRQPALVAQDAHRLLVDLVGAAADLERDAAGAARCARSPRRAPPPTARPRRPVAMKSSSWNRKATTPRSRWRATISAATASGRRSRRSAPPWCLVERADAAEAAVPRAAAAAEHRCRRQLLVLVVDVRPVGEWELVEVLERHAVLVDDDRRVVVASDGTRAREGVATARRVRGSRATRRTSARPRSRRPSRARRCV